MRSEVFCACTLSLFLLACGDAGESPGGDAGASQGADAGPEGQADGSVPAAGCAERTLALPERSGTEHLVGPAGPGRVLLGGNETTLRQVVSDAEPGDDIVLEDGTYTFDDANGSGYTGIYFTKPDITLRSASGNALAVILDSGDVDHGGSSAPITIDAPGIVLTGFTVQRSIFHLVHLWGDADNVIVHNVHMLDGGQQFLKGSPGEGTNDSVEVSCSEFRMSSDGRDNVWGYGPSDGNTTCYTGGIDSHNGRDWLVHDNTFSGIYCDATGAQRPAHGREPEQRNNMTYQGGLSEHAIHMWDSPQGSGHMIERNRILNCARGIGLGFRDEVYGSTIRNNMIFSEHDGSREHDVGIGVERARDTIIVNNTVFFSSADSYSSTIEYRFDTTSNFEVANNLTNRRIRARDGASATESNNYTEAQAAWFVDASAGDLHLADCSVAEVVGAGAEVGAVADDFDAESRGDSNDIGADQCFP